MGTHFIGEGVGSFRSKFHILYAKMNSAFGFGIAEPWMILAPIAGVLPALGGRQSLKDEGAEKGPYSWYRCCT